MYERMNMKVLSKVSMMVLILTVVSSGSIKAAAPRIIKVVPMSYNAGENKWVGLLGFTATIVQGFFSVAGPRYWEPFDIDVTGLAEVAIHERIKRSICSLWVEPDYANHTKWSAGNSWRENLLFC